MKPSLRRALAGSPELRDVIRRHEDRYEVRTARGGHLDLIDRQTGRRLFKLPATPSDWRTARNVEARIRRHERGSA